MKNFIKNWWPKNWLTKGESVAIPSLNETNRKLVYGNLGYNGYQQLVKELDGYFSTHPTEAAAYKAEIDFIKNRLNDIPSQDKILHTVLPYPFVFQFNYSQVEVFKDEAAGMFYVYLDGKRLYYHKGFTNALDVQKSFTYISAEQHPDSPHRYLNDAFTIDENDTVVDLGAAEGNFSLMVVDKVKRLLIVEADEIWIEALYKTFEPWKHKVEIVNRFIGDKDDQQTITLTNLHGENAITAFKMDIEGAEISVLKSAASLLKTSNIKMAITTYHRQTDAEHIKALLQENGYHISFSPGFMLFVYDELKPPYFRRGLIKASKTT